MEFHFYTTFDNVQMLRDGDSIKVWNKSTSVATDIHISLNSKDYSLHKLNEVAFEVSKIY